MIKEFFNKLVTFFKPSIFSSSSYFIVYFLFWIILPEASLELIGSFKTVQIMKYPASLLFIINIIYILTKILEQTYSITRNKIVTIKQSRKNKIIKEALKIQLSIYKNKRDEDDFYFNEWAGETSALLSSQEFYQKEFDDLCADLIRADLPNMIAWANSTICLCISHAIGKL